MGEFYLRGDMNNDQDEADTFCNFLQPYDGGSYSSRICIATFKAPK